MIDDALKTDARLIGMVQPNAVPGRDKAGLQRIGCAGRISQFSETEDGRYMITLAGISRFRVQKEVCPLYASPSPRDRTRSRMPPSA